MIPSFIAELRNPAYCDQAHLAHIASGQLLPLVAIVQILGRAGKPLVSYLSVPPSLLLRGFKPLQITFFFSFYILHLDSSSLLCTYAISLRYLSI